MVATSIKIFFRDKFFFFCLYKDGGRFSKVASGLFFLMPFYFVKMLQTH